MKPSNRVLLTRILFLFSLLVMSSAVFSQQSPKNKRIIADSKVARTEFIKADKFYTQISQDSWSVLEKMQAIGNQAWYAIESARADFYAALLQVLVEPCKAP